jgi:hypothetical protein
MSQNFIEAMFQGPKDIATAQRIVKVTVYVSLFITLLSAGFAIAGFYQTSSDTQLQYLLDPWSLIDVFLMLIFTFFLYKRKLWAAIGLVVHLLLNLIILYVDLDKLPGVIAVCKLALFISASRSVYLINKENKISIEQNA